MSVYTRQSVETSARRQDIEFLSIGTGKLGRLHRYQTCSIDGRIYTTNNSLFLVTNRIVDSELPGLMA